MNDGDDNNNVNETNNKPIYKLLVSRKLDLWYRLSQEKKRHLISQLDNAFELVGGKRPLMLDTSWSNDRWYVSCVERFPNDESVRNYMVAIKKLEWSRYCESRSIYGVEYETTF